MTLIGAMFLMLFIPALLTVVLIVAIALPRALRDEERLSTGRCVECGYDLRGTADFCPECGVRLVRVERGGRAELAARGVSDGAGDA